jgi:triacylglycerol lipase
MTLRALSVAGALSIVCGFAAACGGGNASTAPAPVSDAGVDLGVVDTGSAPTPVEAGDPSGPPYPIVLVHGMGGFGTMKGIDLTYFSGVKDDLAAHGEASVFTPLTDPYNTSEVRSKQLATQIDTILKQTGKRKVNLVAHSQGGLDSRILVSPNGLGYGDRIASITMLSTPNQGTQICDIAMKLMNGLPQSTVDSVTSGVLQLLQKTVYDISDAGNPALRAQMLEMSEHNMVTSFNPTYVDDPRVAYFSYGARSGDTSGDPDCLGALYPDDPTKLDQGQAVFSPLISYLTDGTQKKPNDGLVTVQSAHWGTFLQCVPADHLSEVGMFNKTGTDPVSGFDHLVFFRTVVGRIRDRSY